MNAANEVAVAAFLEEKIRFIDIVPTVRECIERIPWEKVESLQHIYDIDVMARRKTVELLKERVNSL